MNRVEKAILGSVLIDGMHAATVCRELTEEDFGSVAHRTIFKAIQRLHNAGQAVDLVTVNAETNGEHSILLTTMCAEVVTATNLPSYIDTLQKHIARVRLREGLQEAVRLADAGDDACFATARSAVDKASAGGAVTASSAEEIVDDAIYLLGDRSSGISTGIPTLNYMTRGLQAGQLVIVGARPSVGKTAFACNIAANIARQKNTVLMFSLEMSKADIMARMLLTEGRTSRSAIHNGHTDDVLRAAEEVRKWDLHIDDRASPTAGQIASQAHKIRQKAGKLDCIFIDYLGLIQTYKRNGKSRQEEVAEVSRAMKLLAREIGCPVVLLSQLNRMVEGRGNKEPMMSDLRESGAVEQDADIILLLHRPWLYDKSEDERSAKLIVAKNRNGMIGDIDLVWNAEQTRFTEAL